MLYNKKLVLSVTAIIFTLFLTGCSTNFTVHNGLFLKKEDAKSFQVDKERIDPISKIDISTRMADVEFIEDDDYYVEIDFLYWNDTPIYSIEDGVLTFDDSNAFPNSYSINFNIHNTIKIYLPKQNDFDKILIENSSGDVNLSSFLTDQLDVSVSYGDLKIENASALDARLNLSSGKSVMKDFIAESLDYSNSYGNADFANINTNESLLSTAITDRAIEINMSSGTCSIKGMKANSLELTNSYGNVTCRDMIVEELDADLSSGNLKISKSEIGEADLNNSYGNITLSLIGKPEDYMLELDTSYGSIRVDGKKYEEHLSRENDGTKSITADLSSGDITINFEEE
jgi:DUF4097 and DUF4098 domain-containing protein YvlB